MQVRGYNVPIGSQPYALAVGGPLAREASCPRQDRQPGRQRRARRADHLHPRAELGQPRVTQTVTLTDTLPANTTFVSASGGGAPTGPGSAIIQWNVPSLAANTTITRSLVVRVSPSVADNTPIVNADYRAENGVDLPGVGVPVTVTVHTQPEEKIYLPYVRR